MRIGASHDLSAILKNLQKRLVENSTHPTIGHSLPTCTQINREPRSSICSVQASMTARISSDDILASVISERGWKHITRQLPWADPDWNSSFPESPGFQKSLSSLPENTNSNDLQKIKIKNKTFFWKTKMMTVLRKSQAMTLRNHCG